ncbi:hypothetical protein MRX96_016973 [Rhipicephalus microplus]
MSWQQQGGPFGHNMPMTPGGLSDPNRMAFTSNRTPTSPQWSAPSWPPAPETPDAPVYCSTGALFPMQGGSQPPSAGQRSASPNGRFTSSGPKFPIPPPPSSGTTSPRTQNTFGIPPPPPAGQGRSAPSSGGYSPNTFQIPPPPPPPGGRAGSASPSVSGGGRSPGAFYIPPPPTQSLGGMVSSPTSATGGLRRSVVLVSSASSAHRVVIPGARWLWQRRTIPTGAAHAAPLLPPPPFSQQGPAPPPPPPLPPVQSGGGGPGGPPPPPSTTATPHRRLVVDPPGGKSRRLRKPHRGNRDPATILPKLRPKDPRTAPNHSATCLPSWLALSTARTRSLLLIPPGGLDLSEIKSPRIQRRINARQEAAAAQGEGWGDPPSRQMEGLNLDGTQPQDRYVDPNRTHSLPRPPAPGQRASDPGDFVQSRSFRVLQKITDTDSPDYQPPPPKPREEDEMRFSGLRRDQIPSRSFQTLQKMTGADDQPYQQQQQYYYPQSQQEPPPDIREYCNHPEELDDTTINPRYRGGNIPSRSFKMLQEMTGDDGSVAPSVFDQRRQQQQQQGGPKPRKTTQMTIQLGGPAEECGYSGPQGQGGFVPHPEKVFP